MEEKFINIQNMNICYVDENDYFEKTIIFLHGWGQSKECFYPFVKKLNNEEVRCVLVDLPGFGKSEEPSNVYDIFDYVEVINVLIEKLSLKNVIIIAHSFGCRISFSLAVDNKNIDKLLLTGAAGIKPKRDLKYHISVGGYKFQKLLLKTPFYSQYKEDVLKQSGSEDYKNASDMMKQILINVVNQDLSYLFPQIYQDVNLFWGKYDDATPLSDAKIMEEEIPNCKLTIVEGSHYAFLQFEEMFYELIKKII